MKKRFLILAVCAMVLSAAMTGCGEQAEVSSQAPSSDVSSESEQSKVSAQPSSSDVSSENDQSKAADVSKIKGTVVTNNDAASKDDRLYIPTTGKKVPGTQDTLTRWKNLFAGDGFESEIGELVLQCSPFDELKGRSLTEEEIRTIFDLLSNMSPAVLEKSENPSTGGMVNVAAFDKDGSCLWRVSFMGTIRIQFKDEPKYYLFGADQENTENALREMVEKNNK